MVHQVTSALILVGVPIVTWLYFCGASILKLAYGSKYSALETPLVTAAIVALINVINGQITMVFYAVGKPNLHRTAVAAMAGAMMVSIYPLTSRFGLAGGQFAALLAVAIGFALQLIGVGRVIRIQYSYFKRIVVYSAVGSLAVAGVCLGTGVHSPVVNPVWGITRGLCGCLLALTVYYIAFAREIQGARTSI
jgi:O-antigen/teichoic acid export membrane protein